MQGLPIHVNTCRDRGRAITAGVCFEIMGLRSLERALPVVGLRDHGGLALTVVAIGLAVAAADGAEDLETESGYTCAGAGDIEDEARTGRMLAEQAVVALSAGKATALLADTDRAGAGGDRDHQRQCERNEKPRLHDCLPGV